MNKIVLSIFRILCVLGWLFALNSLMFLYWAEGVGEFNRSEAATYTYIAALFLFPLIYFAFRKHFLGTNIGERK